MAVIVPNVDMPRGCSFCEFAKYDWLYMDQCILTGTYYWPVRDEINISNERLPDCPLIPITEEQVKEILNAV